ncbi:hypothetical protein JG687_00001352 [Phytophthora cactorum]|uniref:Protein kinase domain-containing protein n=1 Tax=Phytophthora cactorum TaxID=29920 RepID=A0A8T1UXH5_9STRA|nr:hypothetical protein JG687_00001352 [Phytophthora cactorum]
MATSASSSMSALASELRMLQPSSGSTAMPISRVNARNIQSAKPNRTGAFKARKVEPTRFRYFYDRGDLPVRVNFAGAVRKLQWQVDLSLLDFSHYLPVFMEGLRELEEPYHFLALNGTLDMLEKGGSRVLPCLPQLIPPMKANLMTRNQTVLCLQMKVLQRLVLSCPYTGEALVPYYRQLLSIFNLFITKRVNCGDSIDYAQRRQENLGDLILDTLNILEKHGGADAFVNIKYMIPTPALTVLASDRDLDYKHRGDNYDDKFEASCDIGETTLYKAGLRINSSGVTFANDKPGHKEDTDEVDEHMVESRKLVALDKLETVSMIVKVVTNVFDKPRRDQLLTEIRTLYGIESEHLVGFYGAYFQDHALSIVLEFCALGSLDQLLAKLPRGDDAVPERIVAAIAMQILTGLAHLKRVRHVHRDIKPQNILVQQDGAVKLTDFGLARELSSSTSMAQTFVGTFKYMAPERVQNEPYDYKSDIWSLGLVLIECATLTFPYASARSYIDVDANGEPFTPEFHDFIGRCLKKERASVEELLDSPWLQLHNATSTERSVRRCATWLQQLHLVDEDASEAKESRHEDHGAKELKAKQHDEEEEIEEAIEVGEDRD